ncbi:hypothetical protein INR49_027797 [Caranx melampygus]|nr:hypothetical protein INR49_027797 [Caranx melampygus]
MALLLFEKDSQSQQRIVKLIGTSAATMNNGYHQRRGGWKSQGHRSLPSCSHDQWMQPSLQGVGGAQRHTHL